MYKIETHLHTTYISHCGWLGAQAIMKAYSAAGYDAICVTDHYNRDTFDYIEMDLSTRAARPATSCSATTVSSARAKSTASASMRALSFALTALRTTTCCTASMTSCWPTRSAS